LIKGCRNAKEKACKYISILSRLASAWRWLSSEDFQTIVVMFSQKSFFYKLPPETSMLVMTLYLSILLYLYTLHIHFIQSLMQPYNYEFFLYRFMTHFSHTWPSWGVLPAKLSHSQKTTRKKRTTYGRTTEHTKREEPGRHTRTASYKKVNYTDLDEWMTPINSGVEVCYSN
jgi:hypothetical protein